MSKSFLAAALLTKIIDIDTVGFGKKYFRKYIFIESADYTYLLQEYVKVCIRKYLLKRQGSFFSKLARYAPVFHILQVERVYIFGLECELQFV
jgi:hypothetical protein